MASFPNSPFKFFCNECGFVHFCGAECRDTLTFEGEGYTVCTVTGKILQQNRISRSYNENVSAANKENGGFGQTCTGYAPSKTRRTPSSATSMKRYRQGKRIGEMVRMLFLNREARLQMRKNCERRIEQVRDAVGPAS